MISYQNDPSARLLKSYPPPFKGTWKTLPSHLLPDDALQDSLNITLLSGVLRSRLGLQSVNRGDLESQGTGSFFYTGVDNTKVPVLATTNKIKKYNGGWTDITGLVLQDAEQVRFTSIELVKSMYLLVANGKDTLKVSSNLGLLAEITPYVDPILGASSIPVLTDVCTSANHIVGITPPYTVTWSSSINGSYLNFTNWPASNQNILADTEDHVIAIRNAGTLGLVVYKEASIFTGLAQGGSDAQAFRFDYRGSYEGPACSNAIVSAWGGHIYMTPTGRIGYFDGNTHTWLCDGIWPFLQDDIDFTKTKSIFGVYNYRTNEIYFFYSKLGDQGLVQGMLIINGIYPIAGVADYSYFLGRTNFPVSNGLSATLFQNNFNPLIIGQENNIHQTYALVKDCYTDGAVPLSFPCKITTGLFRPSLQELNPAQAKPQSDIYRPIVELYTTRSSDKGAVGVSALTASNLESNGVPTPLEIVDLTKSFVNEFIGFNETGSFLGLELTWFSTSKFEYKGCDIYGRDTT